MQDIDALATDLPRLHPNLFFQASRDDFQREVDALKTRVPQLADHEIVTGLMRIAALPGDGHTSIAPSSYGGFRRVALRVLYLSDGLTVVAAGRGAEALLGGRLLRVGDVDAAEAVARLTPVVSRDNEWGLRGKLPSYVIVPEILHAQGLVSGPERVRFVVVTASGATAEAELPALSPGEENTLQEATVADGAGLPLYRQRPEENYWYAWTGSDVLFLQYNRCQNAPQLSMTTFAQQLFGDLDRRTPRAVVVDVRANGGGDSSVADPLLNGLRSRRFLADSGRLFTLIGNGTFSSAMDNAVSLKREIGSILVGEPTGGKPNSYGEVRSFALPNSRVIVNYSTRFFRILPDSDPAALFPDVEAPISSADYRAGRDPALAAIAARLGISLFD